MRTQSFAGVLVRLVLTVVVLVPVAVAPARAGEDTATIAYIELDGPLAERPSPLAWLGGDRNPTVGEVLTMLRAAGRSADVAAIVIRIKDAELNSAKAEEIGQVMDQVRTGRSPDGAPGGAVPGKAIYVFADSYTPPQFLLASHASTVLLQSGGAVSLPGILMQEIYLADTLQWIGVRADFVQVGAYKGASEPLTRSGPSPEWSQNVESLLDTLYGRLREQVKAGRQLDDQQLDSAMETAWMATGAEAKRAGLIDQEIDWPDLNDHLKTTLGREIEWRRDLGRPRSADLSVDLSNPFLLLRKLATPPDHTPKRSTIALLHIDGAIIDGDSGGGGLTGPGGVGSRTIRKALGELEDNDLIKGVVVRINSPGGSATASEVIWQGVQRVAAKKPVWVSVGSMAASGGYYIAVSGQRIFVNPSSIVGSIGVVGGKLAIGDLAQKLKVNVVSRARGPRAGMMDVTRPWTDDERALVREKMTQTYDLFTRRVAEGRPGIDLSQTAEGRLFAGRRAVDVKLADRVGSMDDAVRLLAGELNLSPGTYDVMDYPGPKSLPEILADILGGFGGASAKAPRSSAAAPAGMLADLGAIVRETLGPDAWSAIRDQLTALTQLRREPVLLVSPRAILVR